MNSDTTDLSKLSDENLALLDVACDRFESLWRSGQRTTIEDFVVRCPSVIRGALIGELLRLEVELRLEAHESPKFDDYDSRFSDRLDTVRAALRAAGIEESAASASKGHREFVKDLPTVVVFPATDATLDLSKVSDTPFSKSGVGKRPETEPPPQQLGRYLIVRELGQGGMGTVYLAHDLQLDRKVALKLPLFRPEDGPEIIDRFYREARAMATVLHPNLCPIFDVGQIDGRHYLTMAYLEGVPLSQMLQSGQPIPGPQAAELIATMALALHKAHSKGVVHRDLKPSNVMINADGEPIIMDFGLARRNNEGELDISHSDAVVGSPAYMAPEQVEARMHELGPATDIYALGVLLYEMLCGKRPFDGAIGTVFAKILHTEPVPPSQINAQVDPKLEAICLKAMSKSIADRYASAAELAQTLQRYLQTDAELSATARLSTTSAAVSTPKQEITVALPRGSTSPDGAITQQFRDPPTVRFPADDPAIPTKRSPQAVVLAAAALVLIAGGVWWSTRTNSDSDISDPGRQLGQTKTPRDGQSPDQADEPPRVTTSAAEPEDLALQFEPATLVEVESLKLDPTGTHTQEAWVTSTLPELTLSVHVFGQPQGSSLFLDKTSGGWAYGLSLQDGFRHVASKPIERHQRTHVAAVRADREMRLFVNGQLATRSDESGQPLMAPPQQYQMGNLFTGWMDEIHISSVARYDQDFTPSTRFEPDAHTLALFHCDEGSGAVLKDSSGHDHHGRISGPAAWRRALPGSQSLTSSDTKPPPAKAPFDAQQAREHQDVWAKHLGIEVETTNSLGAKMVLIPPGEFLMGAPEYDADAQPQEKPQHRVRLTKPFLMGATEVTVGQFRKFVEATKYVTQAESDGQGAFNVNPKARSPMLVWTNFSAEGTDEHPVRCVSWEDARQFCEWLSKTERRTYRLPTDAEWEYACRAGTTTRYSFGDTFDESKAVASKPSVGASLMPVGQLPGNPFGLFDMHGNLNEICWDSGRTFTSDEAVDPLGDLDVSQPAVVRGGAISSPPIRLRSSQRYLNDSRQFPGMNFATQVKGFRVVAIVESAKPSANTPSKAVPLKMEPAGQLRSATNATGLALGDLDGDGDLDLFVASLRGSSWMFRNDGKGRFIESGQRLGDNASFAVALGDLDGDDDLDAFVANTADQENVIWLNDGRGTFRRSEQSFPASHCNDVALSDVDGDKDLDAVVSHWNGSVEILSNDGAGKFTSLQSIPQKSNTGVALGDLDGDGDADLVMTSFQGDNHVLLNDGQGRFTDTEQKIELAESSSVALGDLDRDGDLDLFFTTNRGNQIWFNDGHGHFQASSQRLGADKCEAVSLVDLDADGYLDAVPITSGWGGQLPRFAWLNNGKGGFQKGPALSFGSTQSLAVGDLDGDGDADVVFGNLAQPAEVWINESNQSTIP